MSIKLSWADNSRRILKIAYHDPLSASEIMHALDQLQLFLDGANGKIVYLLDMRGVTHFSASLFFNLPRIIWHRAVRHSDPGPLAIIYNNQEIKKVLHALLRLAGKVPLFLDEKSARTIAKLEAARLN